MLENNDDFIEAFEKKLSDFTGAPYVVVLDRCSNAILLAAKYLQSKTTSRLDISIPNNTYMSVPMTLMNYGFKIYFEHQKWESGYQIGSSPIWDYAVGLSENMYQSGQYQCLSFQQKKSIPIGTGGAILLDDEDAYNTLKRMRHDGRLTHIPTAYEIENNPDDIILGYHMNMTPDQAAKGILLMNQTNNYPVGGYKNYPDISNLKCFKALI